MNRAINVLPMTNSDQEARLPHSMPLLGKKLGEFSWFTEASMKTDNSYTPLQSSSTGTNYYIEGSADEMTLEEAAMEAKAFIKRFCADVAGVDLGS